MVLIFNTMIYGSPGRAKPALSAEMPDERLMASDCVRSQRSAPRSRISGRPVGLPTADPDSIRTQLDRAPTD